MADGAESPILLQRLLNLEKGIQALGGLLRRQVRGTQARSRAVASMEITAAGNEQAKTLCRLKGVGNVFSMERAAIPSFLKNTSQQN